MKQNTNAMKLFITNILMLISWGAYTQSALLLDSTVLIVDTVVTGVDIPWEIQWGADNWIWMTERRGAVSRVNPDDGTLDEVLDLTNTVYESNETGLLGMVLHPDFNDTPHVFLVYNYLDGFSILERLVRYEYDGVDLVNPVILLDSIQGETNHVGSRLLILPDYTLLMTTGDAEDAPLSLDTTSLVGKTLRMNLDGSVPSDNPIPGSLVWSWGHRNAQGLFLAPNGKIYSSEHGPQTDDELNILEAGGDYGWPEVAGFCNSPTEQAYCQANTVVEPLYVWTPTSAVSDIIWYDDASIPEFENTILMTTLKNQELTQIQLDNAGTQVESVRDWFTEDWGRFRDILQGPNGEIYIATNGYSYLNTQPFTHQILRLQSLDNFTATEEITTLNSYHLYPNPTSDIVMIKGLDQDSNTIEVYNLLGTQIKTLTTSSDTYQLSLEELPQGSYLIRINQQFTETIIKQ